MNTCGRRICRSNQASSDLHRRRSASELSKKYGLKMVTTVASVLALTGCGSPAPRETASVGATSVAAAAIGFVTALGHNDVRGMNQLTCRSGSSRFTLPLPGRNDILTAKIRRSGSSAWIVRVTADSSPTGNIEPMFSYSSGDLRVIGSHGRYFVC